MRKLPAGNDAGPDGAQKRSPRRRGRSYAEIIQQLTAQVDRLHEELSQLQLENRDLKLRQEVLEQWCRINRLALQVMHTCGGVLTRGQQHDLPKAAVAAIEGAEEWIQQQLVDPGPVLSDEAAELPLPQGGTGSSSSCTLQGHALSLQEYAVRCLLAHPERYAFISGLTDPDDALAALNSCREPAKRLLAAAGAQVPPAQSEGGAVGCAGIAEQAAVGSGTALEARVHSTDDSSAVLHASQVSPNSNMPSTLAPVDCAGPDSSHQQQPSPAVHDSAAAAAAHEAALQELAGVMLHALTMIACAQLLDPAISYRCVTRVVQLAGPLTQAKLASMVAAVQLSQEQRAQIAARVRVVSQLLAPVNAAWDEVLKEMRAVLLDLQQQQQRQVQEDEDVQPHMPGLTPVAAATAAATQPPQLLSRAAAAGGVAAGAAHAGATAAAVSSNSQLAPRGPAKHSQQENGASGANCSSSTTVVSAVAEAAAADLHSKLTHLVRRLNTLHRTLGWLEMTQGYAGLGVLTWRQLGQLLLVTDPYPLLPRYVCQHIASQWEEEHSPGGVSSSSGKGGASSVGWSHRLRVRDSSEEVSLQHNMIMDEDSTKQQQQQPPDAGLQSINGPEAACSSRPPRQRKQQARCRASTGKGVQPLAGNGAVPIDSMQLLRVGAGSSSWPFNSSQACVSPSGWASSTHEAWPSPTNLLQDHPDFHTLQYYPQQQQQYHPQAAPGGPVMDIAQQGPGSIQPYAGGAGLSAGPLSPVPVQHMAGGPEGPERGSMLENLLELCDVVLEGGPEGVPGQEEGAGAALDALLDMLLE